MGLPVKHSQLSISFVFQRTSQYSNAFSFFLDRHRYRRYSGLSGVCDFAELISMLLNAGKLLKPHACVTRKVMAKWNCGRVVE